MFLPKITSWLKLKKDLVLILLIPILFSPLPIVIREKPAFCAYVLIIMVLFWITKCLPIPITSLLPILLFPLFNISSSKCTSQVYFRDIQILLFGGFTLVIALQKTGLHERIALKIIRLFGSDPKWILLGIMLVTSFASIWISNAAVTSMMLPISIALVKNLVKYNAEFESKEIKLEDLNQEKVENDEKDLIKTPAAVNLMKCYTLSVAYSSSIGGIGSLVGTSSNLLLKGFFDGQYPDGGLNFLTFMAYSMPNLIVMVFATWFYMAILWLPRNSFRLSRNKVGKESDLLKKSIEEKYSKLGPMKYEEKNVAFLFVLCVVLWLTRDLVVVDGWEYFFGSDKYISDATPAILVVILIFIFPKNGLFSMDKYEPLLQWKDMNDFKWDILLFVGGSSAIAAGFEKSRLTVWFGEFMASFFPKQKILALLVIFIFIGFGTEFTSNSSIASILLPICDSLARKNGIAPHYFLLPMTIFISFGFVVPVSTPSNAMVYGMGYLRIKDLLLSGLVLKIFGIIVVLIFNSLLLNPIFSNGISNVMSSNETVKIYAQKAFDNC
ncbi:unnamed protein product [Brachionus calyciflorus]|uniref:Uncharacterized protein n=1 Tax=Brachionus calyciflorus TaxID=104777 RepID=A0A814EHK2_9BILA|nr:unnamed protein product [Brachionus calyciflorus]